jgi:hypothetical protein
MPLRHWELGTLQPSGPCVGLHLAPIWPGFGHPISWGNCFCFSVSGASNSADCGASWFEGSNSSNSEAWSWGDRKLGKAEAAGEDHVLLQARADGELRIIVNDRYCRLGHTTLFKMKKKTPLWSNLWALRLRSAAKIGMKVLWIRICLHWRMPSPF